VLELVDGALALVVGVLVPPLEVLEPAAGVLELVVGVLALAVGVLVLLLEVLEPVAGVVELVTFATALVGELVPEVTVSVAEDTVPVALDRADGVSAEALPAHVVVAPSPTMLTMIARSLKPALRIPASLPLPRGTKSDRGEEISPRLVCPEVASRSFGHVYTPRRSLC
jgi:hypothetical protein